MRGLNQDLKKNKNKIHMLCRKKKIADTENQSWNSHRGARIKILASSFGKKYCTFFHYHTGLDVTGL